MTTAQVVRRAFVWSFHSFVFATVPALVFLVANMRQLAVPASEALRSITWLAACNLVLLVVLTPIRGLNVSAVTLSSFYIILAFYTVAFRLVVAMAPVPEPLLALAYVLSAAGAAMWMGRPPQKIDKRYQTLNVAGLTLVGVCLVMLVIDSRPSASRQWVHATGGLTGNAPHPVRMPQPSPDIYYIVLDGLGRPDVLHERYGVDLRPELSRLRELGWALPGTSRANYSQTYLSLASALNGTYLDPVVSVMQDSRDRRALHDVIQQSGPLVGLKQRGYRFRMVGSNTSVTRTHGLADECVCRAAGLTEFENGLLTITPFRALPLYEPTFGSHYAAVVGAFDAITAEPIDARPQIVLAHVITPHPPFVLDEAGQPIVLRGPLVYGDGDHFAGSVEDYRTGYAKQVRYTMRQLVQLAERIDAAGRPAIVVVHGDHGPGAAYSHRSLAATDVSERFPIFMGLRLDDGHGRVPDDLSPVNVFRVIFNARFGGEFELLPNRSYYSTWDQPYRLAEVGSSEFVSVDGDRPDERVTQARAPR